MTRRDEISSAEKLLKAIRAKSAPPDENREGGRAASAGQPGRFPFFSKRIIPLSKKKITVGVDIGRDELILAKVAQIASNRWKLLDCRSIPFPKGILRQDARFPEFLGTTVTGFSGHEAFELWGQMSSGNLDMRLIKIPKVAKGQIINAVYWTVKRDANLNEKESLLDFEVLGEATDKGVAKLSITAYILPRDEVSAIKDLFSRSGLKLAGLTVSPFAIQNLLRSGCLPASDKACAALYIGSEHSRIDVFSQGNLVLTRGIRAGVNSMVEAFHEEAFEVKQRAVGADGVEEILMMSAENEAGKNREEAKALLRAIFSKPLGTDGLSDAPSDPQEELVFEMIRPALDRLVRQVERTLEHYSGTSGSETVGTIYVSAAAGHWERVSSYIGEQLGLKQRVMDPFNHGTMTWDEALAPREISERIRFATAVGLGLSSNARTPNLVLTYKAKAELASVARINLGIFCAFLAFVVVLMGVFSWQSHLARQKEAQLVRLRHDLEQFSPSLNGNELLAMASKATTRLRVLQQRSNRLLGPAAISELASLTPANVRLLGVKIELGDKPGEKEKKSGSAKETKETKDVLLDGIVKGKPEMQEATLAGYVMKLTASPLFINPVVKSSSHESYREEGDVLLFSIQMELP